MGLLAMLTLCGNSAAYAQEETIDVTDQIDLVQESAAEWTFTMLESSITAEVEYEDAVVSVTKKVDNATSTKLFSNMYEAIEAASEGDVVKLCTNISIAKEDDPCETGMLPIEIGTAETPITLDLNGYTLRFPDGGFIDVQSWGYLKIIDSTGGGKVTSANRFAVWVNYGGYMIVEGGCLETTNTTGDPREKSAVYNQGVIFTNAGTISGIEFGIYNEGVVNLGKGKIMASNGVGIEGDGEIAMLDLPVFDCEIKDISLAEDKLIYYSGWVYGVPEKKIVVSLANAEQKTFTYGYNMRTADGGFTDPSKVFSVSGISDKRIGFIDYEMRTEAGIADLTEITFPAGNSTYYDTWALALDEENEDLKFYTVTGVNDKSVELTEIKGKKFSENMPLIVSNTSGKAITAQMVTAQTMMANSFLIDMQEDMDGKYVYPGFEGTDEAIEQIDKMDGFEYYGFNGEDFVPLSNLGPVEAHRCWLGIGEFPDFDEGDEGEGEEGGLPAGARKLSVVWPGSAAKSNTGASGETFNLTLATDAEAHGTVAFSVNGTTLTSDNKTASEGQTVTITVTPTVTQYLAYVVQSITAKPSMTTSQMKVRGNILDEVTLTPAGANTWTMTMPAADVEVGISYETVTVTKVENSWININLPEGTYTYDGTAKEPEVTVTDNGTDVTEKFTVEISNNVNAGEALVTVSAKTNYPEYTGTATKNFTIARKPLSLVATPVTITEGEETPTTFTGTVAGFVEGEGLSDEDQLSFSLSLTNPASATPGSYAVTGTLNGKTSGDYGQNYIFSNAASNATAFTIKQREGTFDWVFVYADGEYSFADGSQLKIETDRNSGNRYATLKKPVVWDPEKETINGIEYQKLDQDIQKKILRTNDDGTLVLCSDHDNVTFVQKITRDAEGKETVKYSLIFNKTEEQTHATVMGATAGMSCLCAGNDFIGAATEGLALASNVGADGVSSFAQMGGGSIRQETGVRAMARGADDEMKVEWGVEYLILKDCDLEFILHTERGPITIESITFRRPGDANGDDKVNAADIVEMINAKNGKASEHFNLTNADINHDRYITQDDIDAVVKLIMKTMNNKENE